MDLHDLTSHLNVGLRPRLRRVWRDLDRSLRLRLWFPHIPLFLAAAIFGVLELSPVAKKLFDFRLNDALAVFHEMMHAGILRTPQAAAGLLLLVMSVGLLLKSRLAWVISLLLTSTSLVLFFLSSAPGRVWALGAYNIVLLFALVVGYKFFRRSSFAAASLFAFVSVLSVVTYAVFGAYALGEQFSPKINDLVTALYFSMVTMSTVGYGDIHPETPAAMLFVVSIIVLGITVFATSLSTLLMPVINRRMETLMRIGEGKGKKMERVNHYIIVGRTPLAQNTFRELSSRNQKVTFLVSKPIEGAPKNFDIVVGDPCSVEALEKAGVRSANAVLALSDDVSENAFVILAVKELAGKVKTVTVANGSDNLARLKWVQPDLIIAPQILGGELLAMALTGEKVDSEKLLKELLYVV